MEATTQTVSVLIGEIEKKLRSILSDEVMDTDWSVWFDNVQVLRAHLDEQLKAINRREEAKHASLLNSVNSFKSQV